MPSGTKLILKLLLIGAICIVTPEGDKAYAQEGNQDASSCAAFMPLFGYLDRARTLCEFGRLQKKHEKIAKNCLASSAAEALKFYNGGATEFQRAFEEDKKQACERVSLQFASAFQSNEFAALDQKDSLVQSAMTAGEYSKALALAKELEVEAKATAGPSSQQYASALNTIGIIYFLMGRERDAVSALNRALPLIQSSYGENSSEHAKVLNNIAETLFRLFRYKESAQIYRRALDAHEKADGSNKIDVAETAMGLANALSELGQYAEAERLFSKAIEYQAGLGTSNLLLAGIQHNLGVMARRRKNDKEAEQYYKQAIQIFETLGANEHPDLAQSLVDLGDLYFYSNRIPQSEPLYRKALFINEKTLGIENFRTAQSLDKLSRALLLNTINDEKSSNQRERLSEYLEFRRKASIALNRTIDATGDASGADRGIFSRHLAALEFMGRMSSQDEKRKIEAEQFEIAQRVVQLSAGTALRQAAIRMSKGDARLDAAIRERTALYSRYQLVQKDIIRATAQNSLERANSAREEERRLDTRLTVLTEKIQKEFPQFSSLASAKAIPVPQVQNSLKPDEALIFVIDNGTYVHVFALTKDRFQTYSIEDFGNPDRAQLSEPEKLEQNKKLVLRFRKGLDPNSVGSAGGDQFDLEFAHSLFERLFGPLDSHIRVRRHWLIVPSGAFTALPFHLLVTDSGAQTPKDRFRKFRDAEWLIRSHAITILPSVESLGLLRALAGRSSAPLPLIGFADPYFGADQNANVGSRSSRAITRAYSEFWTGQKIDRKLLQSALAAAPLPESAQELLSVAEKLKVSSDNIRLGKRASESEVKKARLRDYRIVYFATHGLVAGEVKGLAEPALALAWPKTASSRDDGLLTASEVAELSLNADWVVMSACNTMAGQSPDAEPLSGLARAFFYAGARALLVSHWAVETNAAARLAVSTFEKLAASPKIGRSEALRQSMVEFLLDESDPRNSHPAIWGPFVVIGEGGAN